jgi:hypothetical protein
MARKPTTASQQRLLEQTLANLAAMIKDLSPQAEVEITFERDEDEDAHVYVRPPSNIAAEEVDRLEVAVGERCNELLLDPGLFIISAVCD